MSLRINTNVPPVFRRIDLNHSAADGGHLNSASRTFCSPPTSPFRYKQRPRGTRKAYTFAPLTNTERHLASPTWQLANRNAGGESPQHLTLLVRQTKNHNFHFIRRYVRSWPSNFMLESPRSPRGRSISLFSPRTAVQNNLNCQVESLLPYNAETPHSSRGNLSGRRPHNETFDSAYLSMSATSPTSSLSDSALDMLLKAEATLDSSAPTQGPAIDSQGAMSTLDVPDSSLSRRSSRSSSRNQRIRSGESKWDKSPRVACASPCLSIASTTSASSSSASSACSVTSTCSVKSTGTASLLSPSPTDRSRRSPPPDSCPPLVVQSTATSHILSVTLPSVIQPDMVTVVAKKGDKLNVVADAWHMERDCE